MRTKVLYIILLMAFLFNNNAMAQDEERRMNEIWAYRNYIDESNSFLFTPWRYSPRALPYAWDDSFLSGISFKSLSDSRVPYTALGAVYSIATQRDKYFTFYPEAERTGGFSQISVSSRTYTHSIKAGYNINNFEDKGYALEFAVERAFGRSMLIDGLFTDGYDFAVSGAVDLKSAGVLRFTAMASPGERSVARPTTAEAYELSGNNLYNPSWGMQQGRERSVNVRRSFEPILLANHTLNISKELELTTSVAFHFGRNSYSALNWQGTPNPYPDYYAFLPSAQDSKDAADLVRESWASDVNARQINFESLYSLNNTADGRAKYIVEERVTEPVFAALKSKLRYKDFTVAISATLQSEYHYKELNSLLGGGYWLDIDSFVQQDNDVKDKTQNNLLSPNRHIGVGDHFGYNYSINNLRAGAEATYNRRFGALEVGARADFAVMSTQRVGYYEKENFAGGESLGASEVAIGIDGSVGADLLWHFSPRSNATLSSSLTTLAPRASEIFISEEYRNAFTPAVGSSEIFSVEAGYNYNGDKLKITSALYYYGQNGATELRNIYDDMLHSYVNYPIYSIGRSYLGLELGVEVLLFDNLWLGGILALSENRYSKNPVASAYKDNNSEQLIESEELFYMGKHIGGMAEDFGALSLSYESYNWTVRLSGVLIEGNFETLSPLRYTSRIINYVSSETNYKTLQEQHKAPLAVSVDLFGGYTFRFLDDSSLGVYCSVKNLLNDKTMERTIYQNDRFYRDGWELCPQASRMYYALPLNFSATVIYRF